MSARDSSPQRETSGSQITDTAKDYGTKAYETATRIGYSYWERGSHYIGPILQPMINSVKYLWANFPPVRWLTYTLCAFNSIPLALFVAWAVLTFGFVSALAGVGIVVAQGFFTFVGLAIFLPVAGVMLLIAFIAASFATLAWAGYETASFGLHRLGFVNDRNLIGYGQAKAIGNRGVLDNQSET
ncbi:20528_t:CDS:1, partial [Dentiscutata erythropus]